MMTACACMGPQGDDPVCPCQMRAVAVNTDKSVAIAPAGVVDYHLKKALEGTLGSYLTKEQEHIISLLLCRRQGT